MDIDVLGSVEFDLTEAIKNLVSQIKFNMQKIEKTKKRAIAALGSFVYHPPRLAIAQ